MTAITKALTILELTAHDDPVSLASLIDATGLPRSTVVRIVGELVDRDFLERAERGHYRAGSMIRALARFSSTDAAINARARAELHTLVELTGETAHYAVYENGCAVYVDKVDGQHPVRAYTQIGGRSPAYATATGKALLAWQSPEEIARVAAGAVAFTKRTHATLAAIEREERKVRAQQLAINRGEWREGVWGIAAPVWGPDGTVIAAFGLSGPEPRIRAKVDHYAALVQKYAAKIAAPPTSAVTLENQRRPSSRTIRG
ncbi:MAG TPA: IclR family transcriptional regulator [Burkholderiales bacterium]|nr:IclR family transcriptional regulator [Burkholderiales bacterium]